MLYIEKNKTEAYEEFQIVRASFYRAQFLSYPFFYTLLQRVICFYYIESVYPETRP